MTTARFDAPTVVASADELQTLFAGGMISMAKGSHITFEGTISIDAGVELAGECAFADGTRIGTGSILTNVKLGAGNHVRPYSIMSDVTAGDGNLFGPFCFIRDDCKVANNCILGAHVEAARSIFASGVKVSHRAFIGDATIGESTIIGAGVVFCNYDGQGRQLTKIAATVTVGSGTLLVPPLSIGEHAVIAAGSTLTKDVAPHARIIQKR